MFAENSLPIFANLGADNIPGRPVCVMEDSACTRFHLARVFPGGGSRTLALTFYDPGDLLVCWQEPDPDAPPPPAPQTRTVCERPSEGGTLQILPPEEARLGGPDGPPLATWDCAVKSPGAGAAVPLPDCKFTSLDSSHNGKILELEIGLPTDYWCDVEDAGPIPGCWIRAVFEMPRHTSGGQTIVLTDNTTWSATLVGDPVRLVE
ncbi:MAG: hypothetical protein M5U14_04895 [Acidimicrobiia bacterium]|nr:hypothetical protein [Acidimicrobiia bacterium]